MGALVGMAAIFAGASRAMLASAVFAFETTLQPVGLLPLMGGCATSYLVSALLMRHSIMTEKIARRGVRVPAEYHADFLDRVLVRDVAARTVVSLNAEQTLDEVRAWIAANNPGSGHQGFPVVDGSDDVPLGVLTRRTLLDPSLAGTTKLRHLIKRPIVIVYDDCTLREAADHMVNHDIGRLPVVQREAPGRMIGIVTRSDLLAAHRRRLQEHREPRRTFFDWSSCSLSRYSGRGLG
jgi:CBS domain-containing protein